MAPSRLPEPSKSPLTDRERGLLIDTAADSIEHGVHRNEAFPVVVDRFPASLQQPGATFVTLKMGGDLRGCIGSTQAYRPLVLDVAENAFAAAFRDPRFAAVRVYDLPHLTFSISMLGPNTELRFESEQDLLALLRPGTDGLTIEDGTHRATFLPQVWESLPQPQAFLAHLKRKAGLSEQHWSDALRAYRYTTECVTEDSRFDV